MRRPAYVALALVAACVAPPAVGGDAIPATIPPTAAPTAAVTPATDRVAPPTTTAPVAFEATVDLVTAADLGASWRDGCPVGPEGLRRLRLRHHTIDGTVSEGELIVHREVADDVVAAFGTLFEAGFPIERMEPVHHHGADDDRSMAANNTSAFNCRRVTGGRSWSEHAFGTAIDINPVQNPYVRESVVLPPAGAGYLDRTDVRPGMLTAGGPGVSAFEAIGWSWGGDWQDPDFQHLSVSGR